MPLSYDGTNGLFTHLGKLVQHYNAMESHANDVTDGLDAVREDLLDTFQAANQDLAIDGLVTAIERWKDEYVGRRSELVEYFVRRLQDQATVLDELSVNSADVSEILQQLIVEMRKDNQTVKQSSVVVSSATAAVANQGGGVLLVTDKLDGATSPGAINGFPMAPQLDYKNRKTELAGNESFVFRVVADSFQDGLPNEGADIEWQGQPIAENHSLGNGGSGFVSIVQPIHVGTSSYLSNADFEDFTSDAPNNWDIVQGQAGIDFSSTTDSATGNSALSIQGQGSNAELAQALSLPEIIANRAYAVTVKLKRGSSATGNLDIRLVGSGYASSGSEMISVLASGLTQSYVLHSFFVIMPSIIPDDLKLEIAWNNTTSGQIFIDDIGFGPVNYGGGFGVVAVRDSGPFVRGDQYDINATNSEGTFQKFFQQSFGVQLPSSGTPTIGDSLAGNP